MDKISTLHPKGDLTTNIYPNIVADNIPTSVVTTDKLANFAVTTDKIENLSVTAVKLADKVVTNAKLADKVVTNAKLADKVVTNAKLADNSVSTVKLVDSSVTTEKLAGGSVTADKLDATVTSQFTKHLYSLQFNISDTYVTIFTNYTPEDETLPLNENILLFNGDKTMACTESVKNAIINISNYCFDGVLTVSTDATVTGQRFYNNTQLEVNGNCQLRIDLKTFVCGENTGYEVYLKVKELA